MIDNLYCETEIRLIAVILSKISTNVLKLITTANAGFRYPTAATTISVVEKINNRKYTPKHGLDKKYRFFYWSYKYDVVSFFVFTGLAQTSLK